MSEPILNGQILISIERYEQIEKHGYNAGHDDLHFNSELAIQAATLCFMGTPLHNIKRFDNGDPEYSVDLDPLGLFVKLCNSNRIHQLKVAGALIAAEIDRLHRAESAAEK